MIESNLGSLVAISPDGRITDVNEATVKVTGILHEELIGTAFSATPAGPCSVRSPRPAT
jgi:PAS domain-containing protein